MNTDALFRELEPPPGGAERFARRLDEIAAARPSPRARVLAMAAAVGAVALVTAMLLLRPSDDAPPVLVADAPPAVEVYNAPEFDRLLGPHVATRRAHGHGEHGSGQRYRARNYQPKGSYLSDQLSFFAPAAWHASCSDLSRQAMEAGGDDETRDRNSSDARYSDGGPRPRAAMDSRARSRAMKPSS